MSAARRVGIDIGGTAIKAGAAGADGRVLERREIPAEIERGPEHVADRIAALARELGFQGALGVGVPGLLDRARGAVIASPNLASLDGFPLRDELARRLALPPDLVVVENDANVAALGEHWAGAGRGVRDLAMVTLGTGVGGGLVLDGALYAGTDGMGGEIGHLVIEPEGPRCGCGRRGCVEMLASATAARRRARERGLTDDLEALSARARAGSAPERELLEDVGRDLGHGLALCVTLLDLRTFLIGGGFGAALDLLEGGIRKGIAERSFGRDDASIHVLRAALGPDAGWIGAAQLASLRLAGS